MKAFKISPFGKVKFEHNMSKNYIPVQVWNVTQPDWGTFMIYACNPSNNGMYKACPCNESEYFVYEDKTLDSQNMLNRLMKGEIFEPVANQYRTSYGVISEENSYDEVAIFHFSNNLPIKDPDKHFLHVMECYAWDKVAKQLDLYKNTKSIHIPDIVKISNWILIFFVIIYKQNTQKINC